jgi:hypothetical protein
MNDKYAHARDLLVKEGFIPLDSKSYPVLRNYNHCSLLQGKSATMFVTWYWNYFGLYKIIDECLCSVFFYEGRDIYWTIHRPQENAAYPLQPIINTLYELCKKTGFPFLQIKFIDEHLLTEYESVQGYTLQTTWSIDNSEYAYRTKDLANLAGPHNCNKKRRIKKFLNMNDISIHPITNENVRFCLEIEDEWCSHQDCSLCGSFIGCEKKALEMMLDIFDDTIHTGLFFYCGEKRTGYIISEKISKKLGFLSFGKSIVDDGLVYLIYTMCENYLTDIEYINVDEDMGHQGLRNFKRLLGSHELWHKYIVTYGLEI